MPSICSRTYSRKSVAICSFRLRPVCSFQPDFAGQLDQARLDVMVHVFDGRVVSRRHTSRARSVRARTSVAAKVRRQLNTPAFASADACALLAATSYGSSTRSKGNDRCHCSNSASGSWLKAARPHLHCTASLVPSERNRSVLRGRSFLTRAQRPDTLRLLGVDDRSRARRQSENADEILRRPSGCSWRPW